MTAENPSEVTIFREARKVECSDERAAFLDQACGENPQLRERVEKLLAAAETDSVFFEQPLAEFPAVPSPTVALTDANQNVLRLMDATMADVPSVSLREEKQPDGPIQRPSSQEIPRQPVNGRYRLDAEIARGGMGAILRGRDVDIGRDLAVKVLLTSHKDRPEVVQRFIEEAQISGQLQHPGIAPVYDIGQFADERPYMSMKLVKGDTLSKQLADRDNVRQDRSKLIGIFKQICETMAYAHSRGVIHRDLKPANIMVGAFGEVQVMDWGLAKVLAEGGVADEKKARQIHDGASIIQTLRSSGSESPAPIGSFGTAGGSGGSETQMGSVMGTPAYMPPEQALGEIDMLDQRADVFGLGAILTEILTGKPPYVADDGTQIYRMASRGKLDDCFTRLDECGADEQLITLAKQCLEVEPSDRPMDASALAEQVAGYLASVETKLRNSEVQRARFRVTLGLGAAALAILIAGIVATAWQAREAKRQTLVAQDARDEANTERDNARAAEQNALDEKVIAEEAKLREETLAKQRRRELYAANMQLADQLYNGQNGEQKRIEQLLAAWIPVDDQEEDLREFSWRYQWHRLHKSANLTVQTPCKGVAFTPENKMVVTDSDGLHEIDENGNKHELINWSLGVDWSYFSPDGRWVAINVEAGIDLYHIKSRKKVLSLKQNRCSFSSNGEYLAAFRSGARVDSLGPDEDAISVWKLEENDTATSIAPLVTGDVTKLPAGGASLTMGNDGKSFLLRNSPGLISVFEVGVFLDGNPEPITWGLTDGARACAWSTDGKIIASAGGVGIVELRLAADVSQKLTIRTHGRPLRTVRFSSDGKRLAVGGKDGTIDVWDVSELASLASRGTQNQQEEANDLRVPSIQTAMPRLIRTIKAHIFEISYIEAALNFSADGRLLASRDSTGIVKLWALVDAFEDQTETKVARLSEAKALKNGSESRATIGTAKDASERRATISGPGFELSSRQFDVSQLGEDLINGAIPVEYIQELRGIPKIDRVAPENIVQGSFETGERIAAVFDPEHGRWQKLNKSALFGYNVELMSGPIGTTVRLKLENSQDTQHEVTLRRTKVAALGAQSVAISPDTEHVAVAGDLDGVTRLNLRTHTVKRHPIRATSVAYSPDGRLLAVAGPVSVFIMDCETDEELYRLDSGLDSLDVGQFPLPNQYFGDLAFSPDGKFLAHVSGNRYAPQRSDLTVYRTSDFKKIGDGPLHKTEFSMNSVVFSPDSSCLLVGDLNGQVHIWGTSDWKTRGAIATSHTFLSSMAISPDGKRLYVGSRMDNRSVTIWDLEKRKQLHRLNSQRVGYMALSPDGRTLAVGSFDHNVSLWDAHTGMRLQTIQTHADPVFGVAFSKDGKRLATLDQAVLRFWDADTKSDISEAPDTLRAMLRLANWRLEQERYEDAEVLFSKVAELNEETQHLSEKQLSEMRRDQATSLQRRAQMMEELGSWDEALEYRTALVRLEPDNHFHQYRVASAYLYQEKPEEFWQVWQKMFDRWGDTESPRIGERIAKLRFFLDVPDRDLQGSFKIADRAFEERKGALASFDVLLKGMAEYRRGNFVDALQHLDDAKTGFEEGVRFSNNASMCQYFASMPHHRLGDSEAARAAFLDAQDRQHAWETDLRKSIGGSWLDWQQTEVVRREAAALLGIEESNSPL